MRRVLLGALAIVIAAVVALRLFQGSPPHVIVVVFDALRADRLGAYGGERGLTPFIDGLAARGVVFANAYAASSWTVPSVASLFTSRYPSQHQVVTTQSKLSEGEITLAENLGAGGYRTAGFVANVFLHQGRGYEQGFAHWEVWHQPPKTRGDELRRHALQWLDEDRAKAGPLFLYVHSMDTHAPFLPPEPFRSQHVAASVDDAAIDRVNGMLVSLDYTRVTANDVSLLDSLYDAEVAAADAELKTLFGELEARGLLDGAIVVVTADHGEELKEHGRLGHGSSLFQEVLRVPLIVLGRGIAKGRVIEQNVSLIDLAPTLLDLTGLAPEPAFEGRSLAAHLRPDYSGCGGVSPARPAPADVFFELLKTGSLYESRRHSRGILRGSMKLLVGVIPRSRKAPLELYDLAGDPDETRPASEDAGGDAEILAAALQARTDVLASRSRAAETGDLDEATKEKLRALGYSL
jgi:arylsulfatase A-like enzyme